MKRHQDERHQDERHQDFGLPRYESTGRYRRALLLLCVAGMAGGALLAWGYQALQSFLPFVLLKLLAAVVFALVVGGVAWQVVQSGHCRSRRLAMLVSLLISLGSLSASYLWGWQRDRDLRLAETPYQLQDAVKADFTPLRWLERRREEGWTVGSAGSDRVNGGWVLFFWGAEALVVVIVTRMLADIGAQGPYCESCGRWTDERHVDVRGCGREEVVGRLRRRDLVGVVVLEGPEPPGDRYTLSLTGHACPACERTWLSIEEIERVPVGQGKTRKQRAFVARCLELEPGPGRLLRDRVWPRKQKAA